MRSFRPPQVGSSPAALPALLRATHLLGLALGSALAKLRDSGVTAARMFERAEESALPPASSLQVAVVTSSMQHTQDGDLLNRTSTYTCTNPIGLRRGRLWHLFCSGRLKSTPQNRL